MLSCVLYWFFFFKQKTAYEMRISDWSSDVCSSDLSDPIAKSPLLSMTPDAMAGQIATAASGARREDARLVAEARAGLDQAAREIGNRLASRSEEHTSELQSLMRISYAVFCLKKKIKIYHNYKENQNKQHAVVT